MKVLLDENLPQKLRHQLPDHDVFTIGYLGWKGFTNGKLLDLAEGSFDAFLTMDRKLTFQQNLSNRKISIILLIAPDNQLHTLSPLMPDVQAVLGTIKPGELIRVGT